MAIAQVLVKKLPFIGNVIRVNRGPLLLKGFEEESDVILLDSLQLLVEECKKRKALMIQIAPEIPASKDSEENLEKLGLRKLSNTAWSSGLVDLKNDKEDILMSLNGKWRNCYRKGVKLGVNVVDVSYNKEAIAKLIDNYKTLQSQKEFIGLSTKLIEAMATKSNKYWKFNIFEAKDSNDFVLGNLVTVNHGDTSIYLIGTTNSEGRKLQANYVMLWESILNAKENGCRWFDIGGLSEDTPSGIAHFKKGINAEMYSLIGEWRGFYLPKLF